MHSPSHPTAPPPMATPATARPPGHIFLLIVLCAATATAATPTRAFYLPGVTPLTLRSPRPSAPFQCNTPPQITATLSSLAKSGPIFMATDPKSRILKYAYQPSVSTDDGLRWRLGNMVGLHKDTCERALQRRCVMGAGMEAVPHTPLSALKKKLEMLPELEQGLRSGDNSMQLEATREFRNPALHRYQKKFPRSRK